MLKTRIKNAGLVACLICGIFGAAACRQDMHDNPKFKPYRDGAIRTIPEGTVARGSIALNPAAPKVTQSGTGQNVPPAQMTPASSPTGQAPADGATQVAIPVGEDGFPFKVTKEILDRGQSRYEISCAPCHGKLGDGNGMIVMRGFRRASSYHQERLIKAPTSYYYDVITNGFGAMYSYADQLTPEDRWKVIAWIRTLQLSQSLSYSELAEIDKKGVDEADRKLKEKTGTPNSSHTASVRKTVKPSGGDSN
ncbi:MAG: cytochrome c [Acidobacteriota bacterium]|nr:MAG: cytochrome c [Acidobacteriota bacterium]